MKIQITDHAVTWKDRSQRGGSYRKRVKEAYCHILKIDLQKDTDGITI